VDDAQPFQQRGDQLLALDDEVFNGNHSPASIEKMVVLLEKLDRRWEALGWAHVLIQIQPTSRFARDTITRFEKQLGPEDPLTPDAANPALAIDLAGYPLPIFAARAKVRPPDAATSAIAFVESAGNVGLDFNYFVDRERMEQKVYSFDFSGGGVGVVDFDGNGWPDLYLTQSRHVPSVGEGDEPANALFLNLGGEFTDVADLAGVGDRGFGQGPAVGDINGDGFPDLYVTNLGRNVLYLNNGDGTFENITEPSGTGGDHYSLSAAFADLSGDGLPDLYVVNYLGGDSMELQCLDQGKRTQCSPLRFPGQPDQVFVNLGNGQFDEVAQAAMPSSEGPGRGMGLLVADFDGRQGLDVYVANDLMANRLYLNQSPSIPSDNTVSFSEQGRISGVAYDIRGRLQGSMGIAAEDVNRNGMLDIFVTNYWRESNNYFSQVAQSPQTLFNECAVEMNLSLASLQAVGWGTQFMDADLDGDWDLIVANGHLDENTGPPETKQSPHLFENVERQRFQPAPAGDYFSGKYFARAVARLDWNGDGLPDVCITHRAAPVALLTNTSQRLGNFVAIELRGVESSRDAIGAIVEVEAGGQRWFASLMSGSGFSAANQRQILLGLGPQTEVEKLTIRWPRGEPQVFENVPLDTRSLIVQGDDTLYSLPE